MNPGYRARLARRLGSTSHWHSNFRPDRNLFPWSFFFSPPVAAFATIQPLSQPPTTGAPLTFGWSSLSLVYPPQFVFSLATLFDQYFNFAMLRYLAGRKERTGRCSWKKLSYRRMEGGSMDRRLQGKSSANDQFFFANSLFYDCIVRLIRRELESDTRWQVKRFQDSLLCENKQSVLFVVVISIYLCL